MAGKQAKILTPQQIRKAIERVQFSRYPERDRVMLLLSLKAGLRACEISQLTWSMVLDAEGDVADAILLENAATKGNKGGRKVYLHNDLREALVALMPTRRDMSPGNYTVHSERGKRLSANSICNWFASFYRNVGFAGCTSHSGRRTFITNAAKKIVTVGGSLRDVQELAGHASLQTVIPPFLTGSACRITQLVSVS